MYVGKPTGTNIGINFHKTDSTLEYRTAKFKTEFLTSEL